MEVIGVWKIMKFLGDRGVTSIEYALIATLISMVIILATTGIGQKVGSIFIGVGNSFPK